MTKKWIALSLFLSAFYVLTFAQTAPEITAWMLNTTGATGYNGLPANVQSVKYTSDYVYVSCSDIPSYSIGPWTGNPNVASNQDFVYRITRHPQQNNGTAVETSLGHIGVWVNGVSLYNAKDAASYQGMDVWHSNAVVVEAVSFDDCLGHPQMTGEYHNHQNPTCLYDDTDSSQHSPILGYAFDGFPIYGPYAYANTNGTGGITRMRSSYQKRNITSRTNGPAVNSAYPLGYYVEDFEYVNGLGDLDEHNGRFCVTPEYPNGTYAYFVTIDANGASAYPYIIGPTYYGTVPSGNTGPGSAQNATPDSAQTYLPTGIRDFTGKLNISVVPNPTRGKVKVTLPSDMQGDVTAVVYNNLGKPVLRPAKLQPGTDHYLDLAELPVGMYLIRFENADEMITQRIVLDK